MSLVFTYTESVNVTQILVGEPSGLSPGTEAENAATRATVLPFRSLTVACFMIALLPTMLYGYFLSKPVLEGDVERSTSKSAPAQEAVGSFRSKTCVWNPSRGSSN